MHKSTMDDLNCIQYIFVQNHNTVIISKTVHFITMYKIEGGVGGLCGIYVNKVHGHRKANEVKQTK